MRRLVAHGSGLIKSAKMNCDPILETQSKFHVDIREITQPLVTSTNDLQKFLSISHLILEI